MLKNILLFIPFLILLIGCGGNDSGDSAYFMNKKFTFQIDTILIDSGDHFFFVQYGLSMSELDRENKQLLNFNPEKLELEVIDLNDRKLLKVMSFEKEGPNGIGGGYILKLQRLPNQDLIFYDYVGLHFLDSTGKKIKTIRFDQAKFEGDSLQGSEMIDATSLVTKDGKIFFGFYGVQSFEGETRGLAIIDLENQNLKLVPTTILDFTTELAVDFEMEGRGSAKYPERNNVNFEGNKIFISTSAKNQIWIYNPETDSLMVKSFNSKITSNSKKGNFPQKVSSTEEWENAIKEKQKEISFNSLVYNQEGEQYWRISTEMDRVIAGDSVVMKTVLTAFDKDLNQLGEGRFPDGFVSTGNIFVLDGMLWQFLNIDDEVAFVRIKLELLND